MKERLHRTGRQLGATHVLTGNEDTNTPVRTLNARLGYRRLHGEVRVQRPLRWTVARLGNSTSRRRRVESLSGGKDRTPREAGHPDHRVPRTRPSSFRSVRPSARALCSARCERRTVSGSVDQPTSSRARRPLPSSPGSSVLPVRALQCVRRSAPGGWAESIEAHHLPATFPSARRAATERVRPFAQMHAATRTRHRPLVADERASHARVRRGPA